MKFRRRRSSLLPRPDWRSRTPGGPAPGAPWSRAERAGPVASGRGPRRLRAVCLLLAGVELCALASLALPQLFPVRHVNVTGLHHLRAAEVERAAGLSRPLSVFSVDGAGVHRRLASLPWVRDVEVSTVLPDAVRVSVSEWQPVAVFHPAGSTNLVYLSDQGAVLGPGAETPALLSIEGPAASDPRPGRAAIDGRLLTALVNIQRGLPALIGEQVALMSIDCTGNLTMTTGHGWKAYFGRVLTPEEFGTLKDKLGALKAISADVNLHSADLSYVNLMNASAPAVGPPKLAGKPVPVPAATPAPAGAAGGIRPLATPAPSIQVLPCR